MAEEQGTDQLQIQEFEEKQYPATIESPINLYNLDCYFNFPPSSPLSDLVLSPLWNSSGCIDPSYSAGSSISTIRRITDDTSFSSHSESYPDGSPGDFVKSLEMSPVYEKASCDDPPRHHTNSSLNLCSIKERVYQVVRHIMSIGEDILVQFWAPVKNNSRYVLATSGQPFALGDSTNMGLHQYRTISLMYLYSVDGTDDGCNGLPGRVFKTKLPEWTPDVRFYSSKEFPQVDHAQKYDIRGTLALPVFEGDLCIGVLELVMTSQKLYYAPEFDTVCKALEAVNLKSTGTFDQQDTRTYNEDFNVAQSEILELFRAVCETHKLPLAQTWLPFRHQNAGICGNRLNGLTCVASFAFYVRDPYKWGFREACLEHHLQDGQGLPGRAFSSLNACFCADITLFGKSEYPLAHHARIFGLQSSLAIPLYSSLYGEQTFVLEFFLPHSSTDHKTQWQIAASILATTKKIMQNSKVIQWIEPKVDGHFDIVDLSVDEKLRFSPYRHGLEAAQSVVMSKEQDLLLEKRPECDIALLKAKSDANAENITSSIFENDGKRMLQVLKQLFGRNLNDAANCLGVSRSTFKRLCRQHGIPRWPRMKKASNSCLEHVLIGADKRVPESSGTIPQKNSPPREQVLASIVDIPRIPSVSTLQNGETATVKARYGEYFIKFQLPFSSQLAELENKVADRLKLKIGTFCIQYQDADDDWILVACNDDLESCLSERRSLGDKSIKMLVESIDM